MIPAGPSQKEQTAVSGSIFAPSDIRGSPRCYIQPSLPFAPVETPETSKSFPTNTPPVATLFPSSPPPLEYHTSSVTMGSSPLTPSYSPDRPLTSTSPSRHAVLNAGEHVQRLSDYCTKLKALMLDDNGKGSGAMGGNAVNISDSDDSPSSRPNQIDRHSGNKLDEGPGTGLGSSTADSTQAHLRGQTGAGFRHFPRFDQASRPFVSDNWRVKSVTETCPSQPTSVTMTATTTLVNGGQFPPVTPGQTQYHLQQQARSLFQCTPTHNSLAAPVNPNVTGFGQLSSTSTSTPSLNPPPTPISVGFPARSNNGPGYGYGHAHHSSTGSSGTSSSYYYHSSSPGSGALAVKESHSPPTSIYGYGYGTAPPPPTTTFTLTVSPDTVGYCFIRPNGTRTRLVPVDMLPYPLQGIPAHEGGGGDNNEHRLVALPVPAGVGPDGRSSNLQELKTVCPPGGNGAGDAIQNPNLTPYAPHQITHQRTNTNPTTTSNNKRMKIYCDKWVHEGVCAFTQQGCKYKHEMPSDRATQHQLGLFLGYPVWWKRRQAELARAQAQMPGQGGKEEGEDQKEKEKNRRPCSTSSYSSCTSSSSSSSSSSVINSCSSSPSPGESGGSGSDKGVRNIATNGGLAAPRWGGSGNEALSGARERLLPPSWRTPCSVEQAPRHTYTGANAQNYEDVGAGSAMWSREEQQHKQQQQQIHHSPPTQTQQQQRYSRVQLGSSSSSAFKTACTFTFPTTTTITTTTAAAATTTSAQPAPTSPYGPIAPPRSSNNTHGSNGSNGGDGDATFPHPPSPSASPSKTTVAAPARPAPTSNPNREPDRDQDRNGLGQEQMGTGGRGGDEEDLLVG
ncbi:hypothetical protein C7999DRAFT_16533 [Corynascus novoguineensis]|uniref:C3H1-type domain-containing protein n=1 Tax=Corynascus novoguineensis TaxID=1126955 RepID=A0AAN7HH47_9PEZI|nr:hypothetical protein C7999DRAFT_16533 [Corynascus novoguineensis]